jgi:hypothetical protein
MGRNALRRSAGKALSVDIYQRGDHRYHVGWKDGTGRRCFASRGSLAEAKSFQIQKIAELERHREGRFNLDDREMLNQVRDLASSHGYTVLQALQEWHWAKGSTNAQPLGKAFDNQNIADGGFLGSEEGAFQSEGISAVCFHKPSAHLKFALPLRRIIAYAFWVLAEVQ